VIYTSYYANYRQLNNENITMVRISLGQPKVGVPLSLPIFYPPSNLWGLGDAKLFKERYLALLSQRIVDPPLFLQQLQSLEQSYESIALCCFEALKNPKERCHRQLVALWLQENTDYTLIEYQPRSAQHELF
jgi:hypothetical protein